MSYKPLKSCCSKFLSGDLQFFLHIGANMVIRVPLDGNFPITIIVLVIETNLPNFTEFPINLLSNGKVCAKERLT